MQEIELETPFGGRTVVKMHQLESVGDRDLDTGEVVLRYLKSGATLVVVADEEKYAELKAGFAEVKAARGKEEAYEQSIKDKYKAEKKLASGLTKRETVVIARLGAGFSYENALEVAEWVIKEFGA